MKLTFIILSIFIIKFIKSYDGYKNETSFSSENTTISKKDEIFEKLSHPNPKNLTNELKIFRQKSLRDQPENPIVNFPTIQLCKDSPPAYKSLYETIYCWGVLALWIMLILALIIYQIKSITSLNFSKLWTKSVKNEHNPTQENFGIELRNTEVLSRLLSERPNTEPKYTSLPISINHKS